MVRHSRASRSGRWVSRRDPHTRTDRSLDLWWRKKKSNMSAQGQKKEQGGLSDFSFSDVNNLPFADQPDVQLT